MDQYFARDRAIGTRDTDAVLAAIANRYMEHNPPRGMSYYAWNADGIRQNKAFQYVFDFDRRFPEAPVESSIYAWSKMWSDQDADKPFEIHCFGPVIVYCNGERIYKPDVNIERNREETGSFSLPLKTGWNSIVLRFIRTKAGCGGGLGVPLARYNPPDCIMPSAERDGQKGWLFSPPRIMPLDQIPLAGVREEDTGGCWYPGEDWDREQLAWGQMKRMYGLRENGFALGFSRIAADKQGIYTFRGGHYGPVTVYLDQDCVYRSDQSGQMEFEAELKCGGHDILVSNGCGGEDWGFSLACSYGGNDVSFENPAAVRGTSEKWLYLGPLFQLPDRRQIFSLDGVFSDADGQVFWRLDRPNTMVRPYNENPLFGRWSYPLGVTLYGLIEAAKHLDHPVMIRYVIDHVDMSTRFFALAMWERKEYGASAIHNHLTTLGSLDDCGAFGSLMLEVSSALKDEGYLRIAGYIAYFIMNELERLPDGAFYRGGPKCRETEGELWADDLFMCVPFLCRYGKMTGRTQYIDEAAEQMVLYHKYLYIPDRKIMSHVYDLRHSMATGVAWGRGNGWVAFTYSEILSYLPQDHPRAVLLLDRFNELCEGYLGLQDAYGLWHQVLTDSESYAEASCTAMFSCAFSRGVRNGWLSDPERYVNAVEKAWQGLCTHMIDAAGNIYGTCQGSGFSFSADYYKNDLTWILNDTHGTGIVLLAGVEYLRLVEYLESFSQSM